MTIASNLQRLRKAAKLSQTTLAKLSGVSQQLISQIETGENNSTKELPALAKALGVSVAEIDENYAGEIISGLDFSHLTRENLEKLIAINKRVELFSMGEEADGTLGVVLEKIDGFLDVSLPHPNNKK